MAKAVQKIILSASRDIPFNKLVLSQSNVRRLKAGVSVEDLAEDIARRGLLQSLNVRRVVDAEGAETDQFEIPAGGRRYRALERLVRQKRLSKTALIPCIVRDPGVEVSAEEDSLAENVQRVALHPLDQFRAFKTLLDQGAGEEEIAARFFVAPAVVRQRLRLAAVSEKLLEVYAEDGMTLEQLMAFTVTTDHARQEQVWAALQQSYDKEPYLIRRQLTESAVRGSDRRARFVGAEAYEAAGGVILRDLFEDDNGGWFEDVALLDRLATERLAAAAETIAAEGWKWIEVAVDFRYGHMSHLRQLDGVTIELAPAEQLTFDALTAEQTKLEIEYERADELPDEVDARLGEIEAALAAFENRPVRYEPTEIARAGVFVSIDADGHLEVDRGYVRPEDEPSMPIGSEGQAEGEARNTDGMAPAAPDPQRTVITIGRLVSELTAHRTLALRDAVANDPQVALTVLLHKLCFDAFQHSAPGACLEASVRHVFFPVQAADLKDSPSAQAIAERHEAWKAELPKDDDALWDWLTTLDDTRRAALLAHCVSFGVNALYEKGDRYGGPGVSAHGVQHRIAQSDRLARAVGLDMVEAGWRPTVDNYLGRVTKPRILEAVREAKGEQAAQLIDHLKKAEMAKEAERLLDGTGWLPEPLRLADNVDVSETSTDTVEELPAFLADSEGQDAITDESEPRPIAAE
ncbi:MAG: ParB domain-containing protein nuclease [Rhodospirillaceae bacterium]|nr:MAG: ParB domain-containing protein nuclease [Rhodospirillaceae bacterium]